MQSQQAPTDWETVQRFSSMYQAWSPAAMRALILNSEDRLNSRGEKIVGNGLSQFGAIARCGRKVLISPSRFFAWIAADQQRRRKAA